ncbi:MAG: NADH-quinone oxidoreductase subunit NuoF [Candidatus Cloacimonadota bacterium]|nr:MAG: NADH-quinone oxidoreductase subunit NuoF [Candidatus Cloacimonadota bacterium]
MKFYRSHVLIGIDEASLKAGAKEIETCLREELANQNLADEIDVLETGTLGYLRIGVNMLVLPDQIVYTNVKKEDIPEIVREHFLKGRPVQRLMLFNARKREYEFNYKERIVLEHSGKINPENIEEYIGVGGYEAWEKALLEMAPLEIIDEVKESGLSGRGGACFPTGVKWGFTEIFKGVQKYFIINADEGEPGTFKDRLIMEGDPHKLLEGLMISAYAVGATKAFIYIRGEYKLCISRLKKAIAQAHEYGYLGKNILNSGFDLDIEIKIGAGAYVCGEETALIESLEGNRGQPRFKPPFPGVKGLWQHPTVVNNVETIANVPSIIKNGADWFKGYGVPGCSGTKVFMVLGDVVTPGLCEVELGTPLRTVINEYAGGMKDGKKFKAALIGGAAGVFIPNELLDVNLDFKSLWQYKAVLGSGAILVMNEDVNIVDMLYSIIRFFRHESCGKCFPCRLGNENLYRHIQKIRLGKGSREDLEKMLTISKGMQTSSLCALGKSPYMSISSAIEYFRDDFENYFEKIN